VERIYSSQPFVSHRAPQFINLAFFQLVWIMTVLGVTMNHLWLGPTSFAFFLAVHISISRAVKTDLILIAVAVAAGMIIDTIYIRSGLFRYVANVPWQGIAPFWILILWANFALTLNHCLSWLHGRYKTAAMLGFIGGPLSYFGGVKLGAAQLTAAPVSAFLIVGVCWAAITPLLLYVAEKSNRRR
jgi:hypothetical protein